MDTNAIESMSERPAEIESASAGTACQTTGSNFAYIVTAATLGVIALFAIACTLLAYGVLGSYEYYAGTPAPEAYPPERSFEDDIEDDLDDLFDELDRQWMDEHDMGYGDDPWYGADLPEYHA